MPNQEVEIILIEDNLDDATMAIRALQKHNLADLLIHLENGADALDFIFGERKYAGRNTSNIPKVIFLDLRMPKVSGIEFFGSHKIKFEDQSNSYSRADSIGRRSRHQTLLRAGCK